MTQKLAFWFFLFPTVMGVGFFFEALSEYFLSLLPISTSQWERRQSRILFSFSAASFLAAAEIFWATRVRILSNYFPRFLLTNSGFFFVLIIVLLPLAPLLAAKALGWDKASPSGLAEEALASSNIARRADFLSLPQKRTLFLSYASSAIGSLTISIILLVLWYEEFPMKFSWVCFIVASFFLAILFLQVRRIYSVCWKWFK